jgi:hypothetical protein
VLQLRVSLRNSYRWPASVAGTDSHKTVQCVRNVDRVYCYRTAMICQIERAVVLERKFMLAIQIKAASSPWLMMHAAAEGKGGNCVWM